MKNYSILLLPAFLILANCGDLKSVQSSDVKQVEPGAHYYLNDIWALTSINGSVIDFETQQPTIEFHLAENKIYGYGGCNHYNGSIEVSETTVSFGLVASTKMACPDLELEGKFLSSISNKQLDHHRNGLTLTLSGDSGVLTFKKVD